MLVRKNLDELFDLPFEFAAVSDVYLVVRGFTIGFNAGVMVLKPDTCLRKRQGRSTIEKLQNRRISTSISGGFPHIYNGNKIRRLQYIIRW